MSHLRPCPGCLRHVRVDADRCPFCEGALALDATPPAVPSARLGRAARMAFGAAITVGAVGIAGCDEQKPANDPTHAQMDGGAEMPEAATPPPPPPPADINQAKPYGAPPADGLLV